MASNFSFFRAKWDVLANLVESAERNVYVDPHTTLMKLRLFAETMTKYILASENIREAYNTTQVDRTNTIRREGILEPEFIQMMAQMNKQQDK
ncbi:hypothetical protein AWH49_06920 [Domibacillus aminovorans]|uniref:Uncharacterized protein n=1 Tax=Domibacillus aminovorans TaxID=29332 RepID=A0A177LBA8_9BACI|nr:hypothetical protein AWH49_06920 [Domibacillus aminovorans]